MQRVNVESEFFEIRRKRRHECLNRGLELMVEGFDNLKSWRSENLSGAMLDTGDLVNWVVG